MKKYDNLAEGLSEILVKNNSISHDKAQSLKKLFYDRSKPAFVNFLLEQGLVPKSALLNALSEYYQKPAFDVVGHFFEQHYVQMFPVDVMVRNKFVPLKREENMLVVVASDPSNEELLVIIGKNVSYNIRFMVGIAKDIMDAAQEFSDYAVTQYPEMIEVDVKKEKIKRNEVRGLTLEEDEQD